MRVPDECNSTAREGSFWPENSGARRSGAWREALRRFRGGRQGRSPRHRRSDALHRRLRAPSSFVILARKFSASAIRVPIVLVLVLGAQRFRIEDENEGRGRGRFPPFTHKPGRAFSYRAVTAGHENLISSFPWPWRRQKKSKFFERTPGIIRFKKQQPMQPSSTIYHSPRKLRAIGNGRRAATMRRQLSVRGTL